MPVRTRVILTTLGVALSALLAGLPAQAAQAGPVAAGAGPTLANVAILDVVMLVDESGSETSQKVAQEKATAATIAQSMLNPLSRVTVIGFGGVNHVVPNQNPVSVVCQPTIASGQQNLSYLATCVNGLHRRTEAEGDDTDYAAALAEATNYLSPSSTSTPPSPAGAIKVILMMTDGAVDVHRDTEQYGTDWQVGEQTAINQQLQLGVADGVQVWPLGFGTDIGTGITQQQALAYLNNIAAHGAPAVCDKKHTANQPHATWVNNINDALNELDTLYADAACLGTGTSQGVVPSGGSRTLTVTIPDIASAAAISVRRPSPFDTVVFIRPDGTVWTDASAISGTDSNSPVEVLHVSDITSADVGTWRITITAPKGLTSQLASVTVFWQGAVRAIISATPNVNPGKPIAVRLAVLGPNGPISDPSTLQSLIVGVTASGDGLPGPEQVPVTAATDPNEAGTYTGTYTAPSQPGALTITGTAAGYGLYATQVPQTVTVGTPSHFTAVPQFPLVSSVEVGNTITGTVIFTNTTGTARQVRLVLIFSGVDATLTSPTGPITVASGNPPSVPFTVAVSKNSPAGNAELVVQAVDPISGQLYDSSAPLQFRVTKPPGFLAKYLWDIVGVVILIALFVAFLLWRRARHRAKVNVQDLAATLRRGGEQKGRDLQAEQKWSEVFSFIIRDEDTPDPHLAYPPRDWTGSLYLARRSTPGMVTLFAPTRPKPYEIEVSGPGAVLDNGLELSFRDKRRHHHVPSPPDPWGGGYGETSKPVTQSSHDDVTHTTPSVSPPNNDPWL
jgi:von Willebrand factor type A domain